MTFAPIAASPGGSADIFTSSNQAQDAQSFVLVLADTDTTVYDAQSFMLVLGDTGTTTFDAQSFVLVLAAPGALVSFSLFRDLTFHDWTDQDYLSYLETMFIVPSTITWSQTPWTYFFLKNSGASDNSLITQYFWDLAKKDL